MSFFSRLFLFRLTVKTIFRLVMETVINDRYYAGDAMMDMVDDYYG